MKLSKKHASQSMKTFDQIPGPFQGYSPQFSTPLGHIRKPLIFFVIAKLKTTFDPAAASVFDRSGRMLIDNF